MSLRLHADAQRSTAAATSRSAAVLSDLGSALGSGLGSTLATTGAGAGLTGVTLGVVGAGVGVTAGAVGGVTGRVVTGGAGGTLPAAAATMLLRSLGNRSRTMASLGATAERVSI